jgi:AcrR family transcriptional regulator
VRDVAAEAGINHATLIYYFPSKEALIRGVVDYLVRDFSASRVPSSGADEKALTPLDELRREYEDIACRFRETPELFVVLAEIHGRARRDPAIAAVMEQIDRFWHDHLLGILTRGVRDGVFRSDLDGQLTATSIMVQMKGLGYHLTARAGAAEAEQLVEQLAAQTERWVTGTTTS